jgi:mannose-6-phosphate isomerase
MLKLASLSGDVKHYDWGGIHYIPDLLQIENPQMEPFAEYWLGQHPQAQCTLVTEDRQEVLLRDFINEAPEKLLGEKVFENFGALPYLLKILDVRDMLSIQVHPSRKDAMAGFEEENRNGVPLNAPNRNYKDANHKPELMVALSPFYLLHGFKPEDELINILEKIKELNIFLPVFKTEGYEGLYKMAMELPQEEVNQLLQPLLTRIIPLYQKNELEKSDENFWAARAALTFVGSGGLDRGIFSIYFFNLVHLQTGEAIFQDAGVPHAYLEGQNVEIMASSDNVLRGGLTSKHIDTVELLKHTRGEATHPKIQKYSAHRTHRIYKTPVSDFELSSWSLKKDEEIRIQSITSEIFLLTSGEVQLKSGKTKTDLRQGHISAVSFYGAEVTIRAMKDTVLFRASVPG